MAGTTDKADEPITAINVTPLVDVCLVLVIIFMAVAPMAVTLGLKVLETRAKAGTQGKAGIDDNVSVKLTSEGKLTINGAEIAPETLEQALQAAVAKSKDGMVIVTADDTNRVGQVVTILDTAKQAGAKKLAILKSEEAKPIASGGKS
jgi:biopolymer transport protein ExbD